MIIHTKLAALELALIEEQLLSLPANKRASVMRRAEELLKNGTVQAGTNVQQIATAQADFHKKLLIKAGV